MTCGQDAVGGMREFAYDLRSVKVHLLEASVHEADASLRIELRNGRNETAGLGEANMSASMM